MEDCNMSNHKTQVVLSFDTPEEAAEFLTLYSEGAPTPEAEPEKPAKPDKKAAKPKAKPKAKKDTPPDDEDGEATLDSLKTVFQALVKGGKRDEALELLAKYKVKKIHEVAEEDMAAIQEDAQALLEAEDDPFG